MDTTPNGWTVLDRDAAVLSYNYSFKAGAANAFAARMPDGKMFVLSPPSNVSEAVFEELLEFGDVGAVAANNGFHHLGQAEWKKRFPDARFFAAPEAAARIAKKNPGAGTFEPLSELQPLLGDGIGLREAPNTKCGEAWAWAKIAGGHAWYSSDVLANLPELPKQFIPRQLFKLTGSAPGYRVFNLAMKFIVKDKAATLRLFSEDAEAAPPTIMVPGHGALITRDTLAAETKALTAV